MIKYGALVLCFFATTPAWAQTAQCSDGWISNSAHIQGTCSGHGGVEVWLNNGMEELANQWCDENPDRCAKSHWRGIGGHGSHPYEDDAEVQTREQKSACDRRFPMDCP